MGSGASTTGANDGLVITASDPTGVPGDKPLGWTASSAELSAQSGRWDSRGLRDLRDGNRLGHKAAEFERGGGSRPSLAWADVVGIGGGGSTTGRAGVDGVSVRGGGREREMDSRGLRDLRDGNRLGHKAAGFERGGESRPSLAWADVVGIGGGWSTTGGAEVDGVGFEAGGGAPAVVRVGDAREGGLRGVGAGPHRCLHTPFPRVCLSIWALPLPSTQPEPPLVLVTRRRGGCRGARGLFRDPL